MRPKPPHPLMANAPPSHQGRRGTPRYHPDCPAQRNPLGWTTQLRANGRSRPRLWNHSPGEPALRKSLLSSTRQASSASGFRGPLLRSHCPQLAAKTGWPSIPARARYSIAGPKVLGQVDPVGFEPTTFSMPLRRAPNCAMGPRLCSPQLAGAFPKNLGQVPVVLALVDLAGFEPATSSVRLMRAPNCATGPYKGARIVLISRNQCQESAFKMRVTFDLIG